MSDAAAERAHPARPLSPERLVGTWELVGWRVFVGDDAPRQPFGPDAFGRITYTADGFVSAVLQRPNRPCPEVAHLSAASLDDQAAMAAGYLSYGGRFHVDGQQVTHAVQFSLFTPWLGTTQRRDVSLSNDNDRLVLATPPALTLGGRAIRNELHWRRLTGDPPL